MLIDDLIQRADINKSTFYLHYQSLDMLLSAIEDEVVSGLASCWPSRPSSETLNEFFLTTLTWVQKNKKMCRAAFMGAAYRFNEKIESLYRQYIPNSSIDKKKRRVADERTLTISSLIQSLIAIARAWAIDGCKISVDKIVNLYVDVTKSSAYASILNSGF